MIRSSDILAGELDKLISSNANTHLVTCPVIGPPIAADKAQLLLLMSGDYRSKKEAAYVLVPAIGRRVVDLGGDLQKGEHAHVPSSSVQGIDAALRRPDAQVDCQLDDHRESRDSSRDFHFGKQGWYQLGRRRRHCSR
jgi:hypothetical protein